MLRKVTNLNVTKNVQSKRSKYKVHFFLDLHKLSIPCEIFL